MAARHVRIPPTREVYYQASMHHPSEHPGEWGLHHGYLLDDDDEYVLTECYVPHDFHELLEIKLVFVAAATLTPMTLGIQTMYCTVNEDHNLHGYGPGAMSINVFAEHLYELDISEFVLQSPNPIAAGDYIGILANRVAGQNANAVILGVRLRYKVFRIK